MITQERLREILHYDPSTGHFTWRENRARFKAGQRAGSPHYKEGYIRLHLAGRMYQAHTLAFLYMTGTWPPSEIDHINGDRIDNRFSNLREATKQENCLNRKRYSTNTSGLKGVCWHPRLQKWRVRIQCGGKRVPLGCYQTKVEAAAAYDAAAARLFGSFARESAPGLMLGHRLGEAWAEKENRTT